MTTLLSALENALRHAGEYHRGEVAPPACLLWPDPEGEWQEAAAALRGRRPLLELGTYDPDRQCGPAIWLRTVLDTEDWTTPPVIYLPGVRRDDLRSESAPPHLQPLVELQYRGAVFSHPNGKAWTVASFLGNTTHGLGLEVAPGARSALAAHLSLLLTTPLDTLRARVPLTARNVQSLAFPDLAGDVLEWLNTPGAEVPDALNSAVLGEYDLSLAEGRLSVAAHLAGRQGSWSAVWTRFAAAPGRFPGVVAALEGVGPPASAGWTLAAAEVWPGVNDAAERALEEGLRALVGRPGPEVAVGVQALEDAHGARRGFVWTELGRSPLAGALAPLTQLVEHAARPLTGQSAAELAAAYAEGGYGTDLAVLDTLAAVDRDDHLTLVGQVLRGPYLGWLERVNAAFMAAVQAEVGTGNRTLLQPRSGGWTAAPGLAVVFVDGLRYDVAARLQERLSGATLDWQFAALPTVTPTAKPAVAPHGGGIDPLNPERLTLGYLARAVSAQVLRQLLETRGFLPLAPDTTGNPAGAAWTEAGDLDRLGHARGERLAHHLDGELTRIARRVQALLAAGYREVRVVTDHGWLLLPGELPKLDLPASLTLFRKGRCAVLKEGNASGYPTLPWTWDASVEVTLAPGVHAFEAGEVYAHGGLSLQESVVPVLTVKGSAAPSPAVEILEWRWRGNRLRVEVAGGTGLTLDLRRRATDPASSILTGPKPVGDGGLASLLVEGDELDGLEVTLVVLDAGGAVLRQQAVTVGENA
ncbi:BREX-1 system phosphatase PglZ type B [Deinococcus sp. NW-56]|uniref:BREX-1 system phosphatase PglZ type B n=1 Tax=Deinococcus sp. NW-56 TaxID=2080419 RepID=UPI000CF52E24|nr:BREX-1 system phosphatase PglZ type B [Deinococcus sp. NW-56]